MIVALFLIRQGPILFVRGWNRRDKKDEDQKILMIFKYAKLGFIMKIYDWFYRLFTALIFMLFNSIFIYYSLYMICCVMGQFIHPIFFGFHLMDLLFRYPALQNVIKSITIPKKVLFLTFLIFVVFEYYFALIGYFFIYYDFPEEECRTMLGCFLTVVDKGLKAGGGIGGYLDAYKPSTIQSNEIENLIDAKRVLYDNLYSIIVLIILMNIVQGIIIDTFAQLRDKSEIDLNDINNKCFICSLDKDLIDRYSEKGWEYHIDVEHNPWNYIFFISYLEQKNSTDYTGIESYCMQYISQQSVN